MLLLSRCLSLTRSQPTSPPSLLPRYPGGMQLMCLNRRLERATSLGSCSQTRSPHEASSSHAPWRQRRYPPHPSATGHIRKRRGVCHLLGQHPTYTRYVLTHLVKGAVFERRTKRGFRLARPADRITLLQIIEASSGPIDGGRRINKKALAATRDLGCGRWAKGSVARDAGGPHGIHSGSGCAGCRPVATKRVSIAPLEHR